MTVKYCPPEMAEQLLLEAYSLLTASNEGYDVDPFDPGFINP